VGRKDDLPQRLQAELALFTSAKVSKINVLDPLFNESPHALSVLRFLQGLDYRGRLSLQCRAETCTAEFLSAAAGLNTTIEIGIQSVHSDECAAAGRRNDLPSIERTIEGALALGLDVEASLIYGLPLQTLTSFGQSVDWCLARRIPTVKAFPLLLLRGTRLAAELDRWGYPPIDHPMQEAIYSATYSERDWVQMQAIAERLRATEGRHPLDLCDSLKAVQNSASNDDGGAQ